MARTSTPMVFQTGIRALVNALHEIRSELPQTKILRDV
jgi:hypothetical protein